MDETWATYILSRPCWLSLKRRAGIKIELTRLFITFDVGFTREKEKNKNRRQTNRQLHGSFPSHALMLMWGSRPGNREKDTNHSVFVYDAPPVRRKTNKCCNLRAQMLQSESTQDGIYYYGTNRAGEAGLKW